MKKCLLKLVVLLCLASVPAVAQTVTGRVTSSADGSALPGVSVLVKGTTSGTTTDVDGHYSISVSDANGILVFSFIGFATQEVQVANKTAMPKAAIFGGDHSIYHEAHFDLFHLHAHQRGGVLTECFIRKSCWFDY